MTTMPSCPRCALNDRVEPMPAPEPRPGEALVEAESDHPYFCARCVLPFTGTDEEYVRMTWVRERYRKTRPAERMATDPTRPDSDRSTP